MDVKSPKSMLPRTEPPSNTAGKALQGHSLNLTQMTPFASGGGIGFK